MSDKIRLDQRIVQLGLLESREKAKAMIMAGQVYVNGQKELKAGTNVKSDDSIEVRGSMEFVSRGGYKLKKAMSVFPISLKDKVCMDIGASTGGFSDCMLQNGAKKVYCVDVGYGQLAWKIRSDPRVVNLERTNIRYVTDEQVPDKIDFASVDVSFISLELVLPVAYNLLSDDGETVCFISEKDIGEVSEDTKFRINGRSYGAKVISDKPGKVSETVPEYAAHLAGFDGDDWVYAAVLDAEFPDGVYAADIITTSVSPISLLTD